MQVPAGHALPWQVAETHASVSKLSCMVASEIMRVQKELPNTDQHRGTLSVSPFQQGWVTSGRSLTKDSLARAAVYISDLLAKGCDTAELLHHGSFICRVMDSPHADTFEFLKRDFENVAIAMQLRAAAPW
jgi:hypothetical protein